MKKRIIVCKPMGGLNDVFCQIERCWEYSIKTQRLLVVDSRDTHFSESLALYFKSTDPRIHLADDSFELDTADTYPRIPKYYREAADFSPEIGYHYPLSDATLSISLDVDYSASCVIYQNHGGGAGSWKLVEKLMVHKHISETIIQLLKMLPQLYAGVHLRGTDFLDESEAQAANMLVRKFISGIEEDKIFVATDSSTFLDLIRIERPHNRIYNLSGSLMQERSPIHMIDSKSLPEGLKSKVNLYAILDLALLSFARLVYVPLISHRGYSGFGRLAQFLNVTKQTRASFFGL